MIILQSVHGHNGLTQHFYLFFDIWALWLRSERQCARISKNQKGGLDQYGAEHFGRLIFATIRKIVGLKGSIKQI